MVDLKVLDDVPVFSGTETAEEKINRLADWAYRLAEALRYALPLLEEKTKRE